MATIADDNAAQLRLLEKKPEPKPQPASPKDISEDAPHKKPLDMSNNARTVLEKRYLRRGSDGLPAEDIHGMFWRVARFVAMAESQIGGNPQSSAEVFYDMMTEFRFLPNSPTFTGAGTPLGQLAACFVLPIEDDMGRSSGGIFQTLRDAALIQQTGGGNGFSFSRLRPKNDIVVSSMGAASGPVGFLRVYDHAFGEIAQGGSRRGANMAVLQCNHPDIKEFVNCKDSENAITNFNISVGITDDFMEAVSTNSSIDLMNPHTGKSSGTLRAKELFHEIAVKAHHNGEPGVLFLDKANDSNPVPHLYTLEATNPCGEQWLGPYESCCLGSINLARHVDGNGHVNWSLLQQTTEEATRFLDDVVTANAFVPAVPQLKLAAERCRRIGLGVMGLADMMYHCGIRYGSKDGQEFGGQIMEFVRYHTMRTSIALAQERGKFPAIKGSVYDFNKSAEDAALDKRGPNAIRTWTIPTPLAPYVKDFGRPALDWAGVEADLRKHGIRNAAQNTVAPTGTISTVAGCEGYGCEPVFALAYIRNVNDNGKTLQLQYTSPEFELAMKRAGMSEEQVAAASAAVSAEGTCQSGRAARLIPAKLRDVFVTSSDVTPEEHIRQQAAMQRFVDNSISKTINMPFEATVEDVEKAYFLAWELGCKGLTVYRTGSRSIVVLETKSTKEQKESKQSTDLLDSSFEDEEVEEKVEKEEPSKGARRVLFTDVLPTSNNNDAATKLPPSMRAPPASPLKKGRPRKLTGCTFRVETPLGVTYVTINEDPASPGHQPFEVFLQASKAGSDTAAVTEAMGRLISHILRMTSPIPPRERLAEVVRQLRGIGGQRSMGLGPRKVRSLPDGIAQMLREYLQDPFDVSSAPGSTDASLDNALDFGDDLGRTKKSASFGDLCPECGQATYVYAEGCKKCTSCGRSEC